MPTVRSGFTLGAADNGRLFAVGGALNAFIMKTAPRMQMICKSSGRLPEMGLPLYLAYLKSSLQSQHSVPGLSLPNLKSDNPSNTS
jgi:hypothetical protein